MNRTDYGATFEQRGLSYADANRRWPDARCEERAWLVADAAPVAGERVIDAPSGSGYMAAGLLRAAAPLELVCIEPTAAFARTLAGLPAVRAPLDALPLRSACANLVTSLAGLHHEPDVHPFLAETARVLRPGGRLALAEVAAGSAVAAFLEGTVHAWCATGHRGHYHDLDGWRARCTAVGLDVECAVQRRLRWHFADPQAMVRFCAALFSLDAPGERVLERLQADLGWEHDAAGVHLDWELAYLVARKP